MREFTAEQVRDAAEFTTREHEAIALLRDRLDEAPTQHERDLLTRRLLEELGISSDATMPKRAAANLDDHTEAQRKESAALRRLSVFFPQLDLEQHQVIHHYAVEESDEKTDQFIRALHDLLAGPVEHTRNRQCLAETMVRFRLALEGYAYTEISKMRDVSHTALSQNMTSLTKSLTHDEYRKQVYELLNSTYGFSVDTSDMPDAIETTPEPTKPSRRPRSLGKPTVAATVAVTPRPVPKPIQRTESHTESRWVVAARTLANKFSTEMQLEGEEAPALEAFMSPASTDSIPRDQQLAVAIKLREYFGHVPLDSSSLRLSIEELHLLRKLLGLPSPRAEQQTMTEPRSVAEIVDEYTGDRSNPRNRSMPGFIETNIYSGLDKLDVELHRTQLARAATQ